MGNAGRGEVDSERRFPIGWVLLFFALMTVVLVGAMGSSEGSGCWRIGRTYRIAVNNDAQSGELRRVASAFAAELAASGFRWDDYLRHHAKELEEGVTARLAVVTSDREVRIEFEAICCVRPSELARLRVLHDACFERWKQRFTQLSAREKRRNSKNEKRDL